jgi:NAD(P)-dependent dehydrogenase (short-subunit alcohol dehydrogenase family)
MSGSFAGKIALVAGCARPPGIGHATALRLARQGATVICVDAVGDQPEGGYDTGIVSAALLDEVTAEVAAVAAAPVVAVAADPYDQLSWERAATAVVDQFGRVDICCALMGTTGPFAGDGDLVDIRLDSWQRCYDVNVVAPLLLSRSCARAMVERGEGGAIVILSSYSAVVPPAGNGAIASARAAVNRITETLAMELAPHRIRVNAVQPLSVRSDDPRFPNPGLSRLADHEADSFSTWVRTQVPLGRPQRADETAAAVEFLCSDEASFITGVSLTVAGGAHSHS